MSECDCVSPTFCDVAGCIKAMPDPRDAEIATLRAEVERAEWFLARSFAVLDIMAGDGVEMEGAEDPTRILSDYEFTFDPNADSDVARCALAARALAPKP